MSAEDLTSATSSVNSNYSSQKSSKKFPFSKTRSNLNLASTRRPSGELSFEQKWAMKWRLKSEAKKKEMAEERERMRKKKLEKKKLVDLAEKMERTHQTGRAFFEAEVQQVALSTKKQEMAEILKAQEEAMKKMMRMMTEHNLVDLNDPHKSLGLCKVKHGSLEAITKEVEAGAEADGDGGGGGGGGDETNLSTPTLPIEPEEDRATSRSRPSPRARRGSDKNQTTSDNRGDISPPSSSSSLQTNPPSTVVTPPTSTSLSPRPPTGHARLSPRVSPRAGGGKTTPSPRSPSRSATLPAPSPTHKRQQSSLDIQICDNCEEHVALVYCEECELNLCEKGCNQILHKPRRSRHHTRRNLLRGIGSGAPLNPVRVPNASPKNNNNSAGGTDTAATALPPQPSSSSASTSTSPHSVTFATPSTSERELAVPSAGRRSPALSPSRRSTAGKSPLFRPSRNAMAAAASVGQSPKPSPTASTSTPTTLGGGSVVGGPQMPKFCVNCGTKNLGTKFCGECGTPHSIGPPVGLLTTAAPTSSGLPISPQRSPSAAAKRRSATGPTGGASAAPSTKSSEKRVSLPSVQRRGSSKKAWGSGMPPKKPDPSSSLPSYMRPRTSSNKRSSSGAKNGRRDSNKQGGKPRRSSGETVKPNVTPRAPSHLRKSSTEVTGLNHHIRKSSSDDFTPVNAHERVLLRDRPWLHGTPRAKVEDEIEKKRAELAQERTNLPVS